MFVAAKLLLGYDENNMMTRVPWARSGEVAACKLLFYPYYRYYIF